MLPVLNKVQMATVYHFQPWLARQSKDFLGAMSRPTRQINKLFKEGLIKRVEIYPPIRKTYRYDTFYSITPRKIANREIEHQSGLIDVLMAFIYLYPDYDIRIDYTPLLKWGNEAYKPDAIIRLASADLSKRYCFIVEFERSRDAAAIYKEKLLKNERMPDFERLGLPSMTKILYVYAYERFNVFWRPNQYQEHFDMLSFEDHRFQSLPSRAKNLKKPYLFMKYSDFYRLNEPVWHHPKGNRVQLIN